MADPVSTLSARPTTGAAALSGTTPVDLKSLRPEPGAARTGTFGIPPEKQQELVATAFTNGISQATQATANSGERAPDLLDLTVADAEKQFQARFPGIPDGALQKAVDALAANPLLNNTLKTTDDNGNPLTLAQILKQVPEKIGTEQGKKVLGDWFKNLPKGQQALVAALATATFIATQGVNGLAKLGINVNVAKLPNDGVINLALVPNPKTGSGLELKASGNVGVKFGASSANVGGSIDTSGATLLQAALNIVLGDRTIALGTSRSSVDGQSYTLGYNGKNLTIAGQVAADGNAGVTGTYQITDKVSATLTFHGTDPAPGSDPNKPTDSLVINYRQKL